MSDLVGIAGELYGLALGEFVAARDRRAKELRTAGDRDLAAAVKALPKPSVAAWTANMIARHRGGVLEAVAETGTALREAQRALDRTRLRDLDRERRRVLREAVDAGVSLGAERGQAVSTAAAADLEATVRAAMTDVRAEAALRSGLLVTAMAATGLGAVDLDGVVAVPGVVPDADDAAAADQDDGADDESTGSGGHGADGRGGPGRDVKSDGAARRTARRRADDAPARRAGTGARDGTTRDRAGVADAPAREDTARDPAADRRRERAVARAEGARERAQGRAAKAAEKLAAAEERASTLQARILQLQSEIEELRRGIDEREHALDRAADSLVSAERSRERAARRAAEAADAADAARDEWEALRRGR